MKPQLNASLTYQWSFNGTPLTAQTNPTLKIDQAQVSHSGTYQCDVTWGTLVQRAEINVKVTEIPVSYTHLDVYKRQDQGCD